MTPAPVAKPNEIVVAPVAPSTPAPCPTLATEIENLVEFAGPDSWVQKHLQKTDCKEFVATFIIKANGMIAEPEVVSCPNCKQKSKDKILSQIRSLPQLKTPITTCNGKKIPVDFKYHYSKS